MYFYLEVLLLSVHVIEHRHMEIQCRIIVLPPNGDYVLTVYRESGDDLERVLRHHEEVQEEVAREMIKMAQSLKQNSLAAKSIILTDNKVSLTCW